MLRSCRARRDRLARCRFGEHLLHPLPLPLGSPRYRWGWVVCCVEVYCKASPYVLSIGEALFLPARQFRCDVDIHKATPYDCPMKAIIDAASAVGGKAQLARLLNVTPATVSQWVTETRPIPAERCPQIELVTGGVVRCEDLRPDVNWAVLRESAKAPSDTDPAVAGEVA